MIREYQKFIGDYLKISHTGKKYYILLFLTSFIYKTMLLVITFLASLIVKFLTEKNIIASYSTLGLLVLSYLIYHLFLFFNQRVRSDMMTESYVGLQKSVFDKVLKVDDYFSQKISKGNLINSIHQDILTTSNMADILSSFVTNILQVIGIFIVLFFQNILIAIVFGLFALFYIFYRNYFDRKYIEWHVKQKEEIDHYSSLFSQILSGLQEIKTFHMLPKLKEKLAVMEDDYEKVYMTKRKYMLLRDRGIWFIVHGVKIFIYLILILLLFVQKTDLAFLVLVTGYYDTMIVYLGEFIDATIRIRDTNVSILRITQILNYRAKNHIEFGNFYNDDIGGKIEFQNVSFGYQKNSLLECLNFTIEPHEITAIVGQSGAGKTSILNLLLRLYKPIHGIITLDKTNIYDYSKEIYKTNVSVVNQKPFVFNMSIRKNLGFIDDNIEHQIEACKRVGIHDFIMSLPEGYDTILREDGTNISGGQKQLISLARTLLTTSEVLLFDEITSSLDPNSEKKIHKLLKELKKDHTIIMITHKPEVMKLADHIIVLHEGKIVGDGVHEKLIKNNSYYQWLQSRKSASKLGVFEHDEVL